MGHVTCAGGSPKSSGIARSGARKHEGRFAHWGQCAYVASGRRERTARAGGASGRRERVARSDGVQMGRYWEVETDHEGPVPVKAGCGVSGRRERAARAGSANGRREWTARAGGASGRRERVARSDGVQMGRYWEVETDHEGLVPVKAGCGVSGRRERAARAGSANGRREWTARAGGASGRRERVARSDGVQMGRHWAIGSRSAHEGSGAGWLSGRDLRRGHSVCRLPGRRVVPSRRMVP